MKAYNMISLLCSLLLFSGSLCAQRRAWRRSGLRRHPYYGRRYRSYNSYPYYRRGWYGPGLGIGFGLGSGYRYGGYGPGFGIGFGFGF